MSNVELGCEWHFAQQLGGREDGPNDSMEENFKKSPYASLVRESIQNSLDAVLDERYPVKMEFSIGSINPRYYPEFFKLRQHMDGCIKHFNSNNDAYRLYQPMIDYLKGLEQSEGYKGNLYYIKVSDSNTKGMEYEEGNTDNPFYAFVRAAGVSSKNDSTAGGSFGFGKAAYFYISPIRTILVSTKTEKDNVFFEGVASLCTHELEGDDKLYVSVGYYDNKNGNPITIQENIPERFQRDDFGTDIYILGIDASDEKEQERILDEMKKAILSNFWFAIYANRLKVEIGNKIEISKDNIIPIMEKCFPDDLDSKPKSNGYNPRPYLDAVANAGCDKNHIIITSNMPTIGNVKLYVVKKKKATDKILYMRKPLMLVKAERTKSYNGFYGVFVCEDEKGNKVLRKTENPAHTEWHSSNWRENGKKVDKGKEALKEVDDFIKDAIEKLFSTRDKNIQSIEGLEDFLYIPTAVEEDEEDNESLVGDIIDKRDDEGNALSTTISDVNISDRDNKLAIGKVMINNPSSSSLIKDRYGDVLSGHGIRHKKTVGEGGITSHNIDSRYKIAEEGVQGKYLNEIPVSYRSFAQTESGRVVHNIVIHADYDISNVRIDLLVGGEQTNDTVSIKSCIPQAIINKNSISGLNIKRGRNIIKVVFADNMKHAVKLDAYEFK